MRRRCNKKTPPNSSDNARIESIDPSEPVRGKAVVETGVSATTAGVVVVVVGVSVVVVGVSVVVGAIVVVLAAVMVNLRYAPLEQLLHTYGRPDFRPLIAPIDALADTTHVNLLTLIAAAP